MSSENENRYRLQWKDYQSNLSSMFYELWRSNSLLDVTLSCIDNSLKAHKVILSACSTYFLQVLTDNPCKHPTIILPPDVNFNDLKLIIKFIYSGEIDISQTQIQSLLKTANDLKIKGLSEFLQDFEDELTNVDRISITQQMLSNNKLNSTFLKQTPQLHEGRFQQQLAKRPSTHDLSSGPPNKQRQINNGNESARFLKIIEHNQNTNAGNINNTMNSSSENQQYHNLQSINFTATSTADNMENKSRINNIATVMMVNNQLHNNGNEISNVHFIQSDGKITTLTNLEPQPPLLIEDNNHRTHLRISTEEGKCQEVEIITETQPLGPIATPVQCHTMDISELSNTSHRDIAVDTSSINTDEITTVKYENFTTLDQDTECIVETQMSDQSITDDDQTMFVTPELMNYVPSSGPPSECDSDNGKALNKKEWTEDDMEAALDTLRNQQMSLTKASSTYGIPSTTLWQRAHRLGIDTPKNDSSSKKWTDDLMNAALDALRTEKMSANKASKAFGIPSSTLYKVARKEGIRLSAPFSAVQTSWSHEDLERALESIRSGQMTVQKASAEYGIPTGTLYGRCKREKIELSRNNPVAWSQDMMEEALDVIRQGQMSINQASIHYNLPYSSLYGRFKRGGKHDVEHLDSEDENILVETTIGQHSLVLDEHDEEQSEKNLSDGLQPQIVVVQYQPSRSSNIEMYEPVTPS